MMVFLLLLASALFGPDAAPDAAVDAAPGKVAEVQVTAEVRSPVGESIPDPTAWQGAVSKSPPRYGLPLLVERSAGNGHGSTPGGDSLNARKSPAAGERESAPAAGQPVSNAYKLPQGHWEYRRAGLFRTRAVWVPAEDRTVTPAPALQEAAGAGCKTENCPTPVLQRGGG